MSDAGMAPESFGGRGEQTIGRDGQTGQLWLTLDWQCDHARHSDTRVTPGFDPRHDSLSRELAAGLREVSHARTASHYFAPGELLDAPRADGPLRIPSEAFKRSHIRGGSVEPRRGRFYPRTLIAGVPGIRHGDLRPFRVIGIDGGSLVVDLDHPLAPRELTVSARLVDAPEGDSERTNQGRDLAIMACEDGPGMQARRGKQPTDFFRDEPFARVAGQADAAFYALPRLTGHVDQTASAQIRKLYQRLLPGGGQLLDLMSSMQSHLPGGPLEVAGLGMNLEELNANPQLSERLVHDLNEQPQLPFTDARFDAAVCSLSVEYLVRPFEVFSEVARVLKPGGRFVVTFSDRWFPPKVIRAWEWAHPFERAGIVMEYFLRARDFNCLHTYSLRGLPRPADDKYAARRDTADPVFAVWGSRA